MDKLFFAADLHLGHERILAHDRRPWNSIHEHDKEIIQNWNETIAPTNRVFILGDLCFRNEIPAEWYISKLHGQLHFIRGNHDDQGAWKVRHLFHFSAEAAYIKFYKQKIYLLHYPCRAWRGSHRGTWHLHGHCHGNLSPYGKSMDVGIMNHDYKPIEFEEIQAFMENQPDTPHHGDKVYYGDD